MQREREREDDECVFCVFTLEEKEEEAEEKEGELTMSFIVNRAAEEEVAAVAEGERPSEAQEAPSLQEDRLPTDSDSNGELKRIRKESTWHQISGYQANRSINCRGHSVGLTSPPIMPIPEFEAY